MSQEWRRCAQPSCDGWAEPGELVELNGIDYDGRECAVLMEKRYCPYCETRYMIEVASITKEEWADG